MIGHSTSMPCSLAVGTLASLPSRRLSAITASTRILAPAFICSSASEASPEYTCTWPPCSAVEASPPPSKATKRILRGSSPAALAVSAAFIQSWLPTVPPAPNTTLVGSALMAATRSLSDLKGELSATMIAP